MQSSAINTGLSAMLPHVHTNFVMYVLVGLPAYQVVGWADQGDTVSKAP